MIERFLIFVLLYILFLVHNELRIRNFLEKYLPSRLTKFYFRNLENLRKSYVLIVVSILILLIISNYFI